MRWDVCHSKGCNFLYIHKYKQNGWYIPSLFYLKFVFNLFIYLHSYFILNSKLFMWENAFTNVCLIPSSHSAGLLLIWRLRTFQWNFIKNIISIQWNMFANVVCKMLSILCQPQCFFKCDYFKLHFDLFTLMLGLAMSPHPKVHDFILRTFQWLGTSHACD